MVRYADVFGDGLASNGKLREGFALTARMELALISNAMNADVAGERTASAANELTKRRESMRKGENMSTNIIRAWKDVEYRKTLTPEQLAGLPANPVELIALSEEDLRGVVGGFQPGSTVYPDCCDNSTIGPKP